MRLVRRIPRPFERFPKTNKLFPKPERSASRLRHIELKIEVHLLKVKINVYLVGKCLSEAKKLLGHGQFQRWVEQRFAGELPYPTAALYKAIYEFFKGEAHVVLTLPLTVLMTLKQDASPDAVRAVMEAHPGAFSNTDVVSFKEAYAKFKAGAISLEEFVELAREQVEHGGRIWEGGVQERLSRTAAGKVQLELQSLHRTIYILTMLARRIMGFFPLPEEVEAKAVLTAGLASDELVAELNKAIETLQKLRERVMMNCEGRAKPAVANL